MDVLVNWLGLDPPGLTQASQGYDDGLSKLSVEENGWGPPYITGATLEPNERWSALGPRRLRQLTRRRKAFWCVMARSTGAGFEAGVCLCVDGLAQSCPYTNSSPDRNRLTINAKRMVLSKLSPDMSKLTRKLSTHESGSGRG